MLEKKGAYICQRVKKLMNCKSMKHLFTVSDFLAKTKEGIGA